MILRTWHPATMEFSPRLSPVRDFSEIVARWEKFSGNRALELEYGLATIMGGTPFWRDETTAPSSLHPQLLAAALEIYAIPATGGERSLSKQKLLRILGSGWGRSHPWGVWNRGLESRVCFRVGKVRKRTLYRAVEVHFSGRYGKEQKRCSDVTINGQAFSSVDLSDWSTTIVMDDLNDIMLIECAIRHDSLDQRRVYGLENVVVNFVPR